jgi:hypothetical protein
LALLQTLAAAKGISATQMLEHVIIHYIATVGKDSTS